MSAYLNSPDTQCVSKMYEQNKERVGGPVFWNEVIPHSLVVSPTLFVLFHMEEPKLMRDFSFFTIYAIDTEEWNMYATEVRYEDAGAFIQFFQDKKMQVEVEEAWMQKQHQENME